MKISDETIDRLSAAVGLALVGTFVLGLALSISSGFAGFWGGLPFWVISVFVLALCAIDFWISNRKSGR